MYNFVEHAPVDAKRKILNDATERINTINNRERETKTDHSIKKKENRNMLNKLTFSMLPTIASTMISTHSTLFRHTKYL